MYFSKKNIGLFLFLITIISFGLKWYTVDFSINSTGDPASYILQAFSFVNGDFTPIHNRSSGWSLLIFPFFYLVDSDNFLDYANVVKILGIVISTISIVPMYILARKFFSEKYSLVTASLFAFEPHLNYHASLGYSEPLYILVMIVSFYFILNIRYSCFSFLLAGILWWIRWPGAMMFVIFSIILFISFRRSPKLLIKYGVCVLLFVIVVAPMLIQRYEQYGDPLYFPTTSNLFTGDFASNQSDVVNRENIDASAMSYIEENGLLEFLQRFVVTGMWNVMKTITILSFPYLIILLPFGVIFSLRVFDQEPKNVKANWILIVISLVIVTIPFAVIPERRFLYYLYPFIILFSVIPIQRFIEYGLNTFSCSKYQKNLVLIIVLCVIILLSVLFMLRLNLEDRTEHQEKINLGKFLLANYEGRILDVGGALQGLRIAKLNDPSEIFKTYKNIDHVDPQSTILTGGYLVPKGSNNKLLSFSIYAKSLDDFILIGEKYDLKYIAVNKKIKPGLLYPYMEGLYENEEKYPYLEKIIDTEKQGYEKLKVKVFKINYQKFHSQVSN